MSRNPNDEGAVMRWPAEPPMPHDPDGPEDQSPAGRIVFGSGSSKLYADEPDRDGNAEPPPAYQLTNPYPEEEDDPEAEAEIARAERREHRRAVIREWTVNVGVVVGICLLSAGFCWFSVGLGLICAGISVILLCVIQSLPARPQSELDE